MNYLIFGGSGFIGTHLVNYLEHYSPNSKIYNLDIVENTHNEKSVYIFCDVRKEINLPIDISKNDIIFNFAAIHKTPGHLDSEYFETNIKGAENITKFAEKHDIKKILFTSSIAPYGASEEKKTEDSIAMPNTPYGISKFIAEKIHMIWQGQKEIDRKLTILRPGVVFGKGENGNFTRLYWAIRKNRFFYPGRKDTLKASIYVKDLIRFMIFRLEDENFGTEIFNCTYDPNFTIEEISNEMMDATGIKKKLYTIPGALLKFVAMVIGAVGGKSFGVHPDRVKKLMISTSISGDKMKNSGYKFQYSFKQALVDWFEDNNRKHLL